MNEEFEEVNPNIKKKVIRKGKFGRKPSLNWTCCIRINYGSQESGDNIEKSSLQITIGHGCSLIDRLIEQCVETMHLEEESLFVLALDDEDKQVTINLDSFEEKLYIFQWTDNEKMEASNFYKNLGAELFRDNKIKEAFHKFSTALKLSLILDSVLEKDDPGLDVNNLRIALYNNLASCHLHFKNYSSVVKLCTNSINISANPKGLYRRALAYIELREYERAENDLIQLLKVEPKNKAALEKYKLVRELDRTNRENYESIVRKMFS